MQVAKSGTTWTAAVRAPAAALAIAATVQVLAAGTHPVTGEALADDQMFTYRLLDQFPTLDPQLNQETAGFHVIRDLFEGLLNQDAQGNLIPGVATRYAVGAPRPSPLIVPPDRRGRGTLPRWKLESARSAIFG